MEQEGGYRLKIMGMKEGGRRGDRRDRGNRQGAPEGQLTVGLCWLFAGGQS